MKESTKAKLKSRKLWITILGGITTALVNPAMLIPYLKVAIPAYVGAQGVADAADNWGKVKEKVDEALTPPTPQQ